ncbi:hypothetical protein EJ02DRAFT_128572 [Clathrospora elynae]|uniref:Secreted protein n=1 Tax=Clathrospora elynae TaxID=706981 RepID=A0A6A5S7K9_9PLEO|nr:hypothetical protein EJ02DRAFT_128572 [Clathrospora elynae]
MKYRTVDLNSLLVCLNGACCSCDIVTCVTSVEYLVGDDTMFGLRLWGSSRMLHSCLPYRSCHNLRHTERVCASCSFNPTRIPPLRLQTSHTLT